MEVYEYISESLITTGDFIMEFYPELPLEYVVIPLIIFIGVFLKQRSRNIQKQTCVAYPRSIRQYISMLFQQKLFWHIQERYRDKENHVSDLLGPQRYEEKLCFLLGTVWKKKQRAMSDKGRYSDRSLESEARETSVLSSNQLEIAENTPETESNSDQDDDDVSVRTTESLEVTLQSEQIITEINYESTVSEAGDSDFRTAEHGSVHKIPIDYETTEHSYSSEYGEDIEDEEEKNEKAEELNVSTCDVSEEKICKPEETPMLTNELDKAVSPQDEEVCDTQVSSPHYLETTDGNDVTELNDCGEDKGNIEDEDCEKGGECVVKNEKSLPPPSESKSLEEEAITELETIAEEEEDNQSDF